MIFGEGNELAKVFCRVRQEEHETPKVFQSHEFKECVECAENGREGCNDVGDARLVWFEWILSEDELGKMIRET